MTSSCRTGVVVLALSALAGGCATGRPERPSSAVGAPLALVAPDLDGRPVDVGAAQGAVRVVDFWATWCEPCRDELPFLDALGAELLPRGLAVYGVTVDEDRAAVVEFLARLPVRFPVLWDRGSERLSRLGASYMPVTLVVDRRGIVRHVHQGWDERKRARLRGEVEALLAE